MKIKPEGLYLDLLKKTLSFSLWPEPPLPLATFNYARPAWKRGVIAMAEHLASAAGLEIGRPARGTATERDFELLDFEQGTHVTAPACQKRRAARRPAG